MSHSMAIFCVIRSATALSVIAAVNRRGENVAATARTVAGIAYPKEKYGPNVLTLELDVTKVRSGENSRGAAAYAS
jgi:hypothetical protein